MMDQQIQEQPLIITARQGAVMWLTINRADKANALTVAMSQALQAGLEEAARDPEITAVVITASGPKLFCAGVDLREKPANGDTAGQKARRSRETAKLQDLIMNTPVPVIVALNGLAVGAGAMIALLADRCVAADHAALSLPEIDIGIPTFSGASLVEARAGAVLARDLILSGRRMSAREAQEAGLLQMVPAAELEQAAQALAQHYGAKPAQAFREVKAWMNRGVKQAMELARQEHHHHRARSAAEGGQAHG